MDSKKEKSVKIVKITQKEEDKMTIKFSKKTMQEGAKNLQNYMKKNNKPSPTLTMVDVEGKTHKLTQKQYNGLFDNQAQFYKKNSRLPNYTTLLYESDTAFVGEKQPNSYTCGSTSLSNCATQVYTYVTEKQCRTACNTNTNGTTPTNLINGAKKLGLKVTQIPRTFNAVEKAFNEGKSVIAHIQTAGNTKPQCLNYLNNYGHWIAIYKIKNDKFVVFDPTKGTKTCKPNEIIKATNGRPIYFYSVSKE